MVRAGDFMEAAKRASAQRAAFVAGPLDRVRGVLAGGGFTRLTGGWADVCAESAASMLDRLIFGDWYGNVAANPFGVHVARLTPEGAHALMRLLAMFHLSVFVRNDDHAKILGSVRMTPDQFKDRVFAAFEFGEGERAAFATLDKLFDVDESRYASALYEAVAVSGFGMEALEFDPAPGLSTDRFGRVLRDGYAGVFIPRLAKALGRPA